MINKICSVCKEEKSLSCFYRKTNGYYNYCKPCHQLKMKTISKVCLGCHVSFMGSARDQYCNRGCWNKNHCNTIDFNCKVNDKVKV